MAEITDEQWQALEPLLARGSGLKGGRPRAGDRVVFNGILWVLMSGEQWSHLPKKFGSYVTIWRRFREWEEDGTWSKVWVELMRQMNRRDQLEWVLAFLEGNFVPGKRGASKQRLG